MTRAIATTPKHGDVRNARLVRESAAPAILHDQRTGRSFSICPGSREYSTAEVYCAHCHDWFTVSGLVETLIWTADHRHGEAS